MGKLVKSICVSFGDEMSKEGGDTCSWQNYPPPPKEVSYVTQTYTKSFDMDLLKTFFNKKHLDNCYFSTVAIKQQIIFYDEEYDGSKFNLIKKEYPTLEEQIKIFRDYIRKLLKDKVVNNVWCVIELHKCNKWVHIHFLSSSKYELESFKRNVRKTFYRIIESTKYEFNRDNDNYRKSAFRIEGACDVNKCYDYMKKSSELAEVAFPEMFYLYETDKVKRRFVNKVVKKNMDLDTFLKSRVNKNII